MVILKDVDTGFEIELKDFVETLKIPYDYQELEIYWEKVLANPDSSSFSLALKIAKLCKWLKIELVDYDLKNEIVKIKGLEAFYLIQHPIKTWKELSKKFDYYEKVLKTLIPCAITIEDMPFCIADYLPVLKKVPRVSSLREFIDAIVKYPQKYVKTKKSNASLSLFLAEIAKDFSDFIRMQYKAYSDLEEYKKKLDWQIEVEDAIVIGGVKPDGTIITYEPNYSGKLRLAFLVEGKFKVKGIPAKLLIFKGTQKTLLYTENELKFEDISDLFDPLFPVKCDYVPLVYYEWSSYHVPALIALIDLRRLARYSLLEYRYFEDKYQKCKYGIAFVGRRAIVINENLVKKINEIPVSAKRHVVDVLVEKLGGDEIESLLDILVKYKVNLDADEPSVIYKGIVIPTRLLEATKFLKKSY